jgi:hypothetical protein
MPAFKIREEPLFDLVSHGRGSPREGGGTSHLLKSRKYDEPFSERRKQW